MDALIQGPIAVVAPAGIPREETLAEGYRIAEQAGFDLRPFPGLVRPHRYLAGTDAHRLGQLQTALASEEHAAVWAARGGCGVTRLLSQLDWSTVRPKPVLGFSDLTALHAALTARGLGPCWHAPVVHSLPMTDEPSRAHLWRILRGEPTDPLAGRALVSGTAEGTLVGGNLTLLAALCGTPWQISAKDAILVVEEVDESAYRVDRLFQQLEDAGVLRGLAGLALGQFTRCDPPSGASWNLLDLVWDRFGGRGVPLVVDLPIGHGPANRAWPVGAPGRLHNGQLSWSIPHRLRVDTHEPR